MSKAEVEETIRVQPTLALLVKAPITDHGQSHKTTQSTLESGPKELSGYSPMFCNRNRDYVRSNNGDYVPSLMEINMNAATSASKK